MRFLWCLVLVTVAVLHPADAAEELRWHDNYPAAQREAEATGKPIFLEFRCGP